MKDYPGYAIWPMVWVDRWRYTGALGRTSLLLDTDWISFASSRFTVRWPGLTTAPFDLSPEDDVRVRGGAEKMRGAWGRWRQERYTRRNERLVQPLRWR